MCVHVVVRQGRFTIYRKGDCPITVCAQIVNTLKIWPILHGFKTVSFAAVVEVEKHARES